MEQAHTVTTAPIFVGGGIAHGPRHKGKTAVKKLNKKVRKLGWSMLCLQKQVKSNLAIFTEPKTTSLKNKTF